MDSQKGMFAKNLIFDSTKRGMLQKDLAERLNVGLSTVSGWESDTYSPRIKTLYQICDVLEVSLPELLGLDSFEQGFSQDEVALVDSYRRHPDLQKAVRIILGLEK